MFRFFPCALVLLAGCSRPAQPTRDTSHPDLRLEQVAIRSWSGERLRAVTTATRLDVFRELGKPGDVLAFDAGITLVADGTLLTAPLVTGNFFEGQFVAQGGVLLVGPRALWAQTDRVAYDRAAGADGIASSDAGLVLTQPGLRLEATGFSFDLAQELATFEQAKTDFSVPPENP